MGEDQGGGLGLLRCSHSPPGLPLEAWLPHTQGRIRIPGRGTAPGARPRKRAHRICSTRPCSCSRRSPTSVYCARSASTAACSSSSAAGGAGAEGRVRASGASMLNACTARLLSAQPQPSRHGPKPASTRGSLSLLSACSLLERLDSSLCTLARSERRLTLSARAAAGGGRGQGAAGSGSEQGHQGVGQRLAPLPCQTRGCAPPCCCSVAGWLAGPQARAWWSAHPRTPAAPRPGPPRSPPPASPDPSHRSSATRLQDCRVTGPGEGAQGAAQLVSRAACQHAATRECATARPGALGRCSSTAEPCPPCLSLPTS